MNFVISVLNQINIPNNNSNNNQRLKIINIPNTHKYTMSSTSIRTSCPPPPPPPPNKHHSPYFPAQNPFPASTSQPLLFPVNLHSWWFTKTSTLKFNPNRFNHVGPPHPRFPPSRRTRSSMNERRTSGGAYGVPPFVFSRTMVNEIHREWSKHPLEITKKSIANPTISLFKTIFITYN